MAVQKFALVPSDSKKDLAHVSEKRVSIGFAIIPALYALHLFSIGVDKFADPVIRI